MSWRDISLLIVYRNSAGEEFVIFDRIMSGWMGSFLAMPVWMDASSASPPLALSRLHVPLGKLESVAYSDGKYSHAIYETL